MNDLDQWVSCWIKDVPYVWIPGTVSRREYLVEPHQIVFMKTGGSKTILVDQLQYLMDRNLIKKDTPVYYFKDIMDCEKYSELFRVFTGDYSKLPPLRCNGKSISNVVEIPDGDTILTHYHETFATRPLQDFPSNICIKSRLINLVAHSHLQSQLTELIMKRVPRLNLGQLVNLMRTASDDEIYDFLRKKYVGTKGEQWGESFRGDQITGRAQSRIDEFKQWLPSQVKSILDIGAGNAEIVSGFAKYLNIPHENRWAVDVEKYIAEQVSPYLNFAQVRENEPLPLGSETIDLCLLFQSMHHMRDLSFKLREVARVMKPGATLFIREHDCRDGLTAALIDIEHELYDRVIANVATDYQGTVYRKKENWTELLKDYGFEFVSVAKLFAKTNPTKYYNAVYKKKM